MTGTGRLAALGGLLLTMMVLVVAREGAGLAGPASAVMLGAPPAGIGAVDAEREIG